MKLIGLLSDTHGYLDAKVIDYFKECDEIWHAGDIGNFEVLDQLKKNQNVKAVWGNIDDHLMRRTLPEVQIFTIEQFKVIIIHIAGKFGSYNQQVNTLIKEHQPSILICGHSHILKIAFDEKNKLMYLNPGAAGVSGFHKIRTIIKFELDAMNIKNMQIIEMHKSIREA
ncbi:MAG: metallophosphoesterase family protein [Saprospiraceae bacterium]